MNKKNIYKIVLSALFISLSVISGFFFSSMVNIFGVPGLRIGISGVFSSLPAIFFGPVFGGISSGLVDVINFTLKPQGPYMPMITVSAVLGGVLRGLMWKFFKDTSKDKFQKTFIGIIVLLSITAIFNHVMIAVGGFWVDWLDMLGKTRDYTIRDIIVYGIDFIAMIAIVFYIFNVIIVKKTNDDRINSNFLKLTIILGVAGLIVTTINTFVLRAYYPVLGNKAFIVVWIPRLVEEVMITLINAYCISFIIEIYKRVVGSNLNK